MGYFFTCNSKQNSLIRENWDYFFPVIGIPAGYINSYDTFWYICYI